MTNFEKWKKKLAEAKDSYELLETIHELHMTHNNMCCEIGKRCEYDTCRECQARWLDKEVEEEDVSQKM